MQSSSEPAPGGRAVLRYAFNLVYVLAVPFGLSVTAVWLLTPSPEAGEVGGLRRLVEEQQVPAGIIFFTIFALAIWRYRHELPLAGAAGIGGRRDIPAKVRARFEDSGALLEEARRILKKKQKEIRKELTKSERQQITDALTELERARGAEKFDVDEFDEAVAKADRAVGEHLSRWRKGEMREYAESIGVAVAVALLLRAFVVEAFKIPSSSMLPTLVVGDHIFVNKLSYGPLIPYTESRLFSRLPPNRGDVAVFRYPEKVEQDFIKRIVAIPGDRLEAIDGRPIINGWLAPQCHVGSFESEGRTSELYIEYLGEEAYFTLYQRPPDNTPCETSRDCTDQRQCRAGVCGRLEGPYQVADEEAWVMGDNRNNSHDSRSWNRGRGGGVPFSYIKGRAMFVWMSFAQGNSIAWDRMLVSVMGDPELPAGHEQLQPAVEKCLRERPPLSETTPPPPTTP